jgi:hypothetical protein
MKILAWILLLFYILVSVLWIANSPHLFSTYGFIIWIISVLLGFVAYKQLKGSDLVKNLILYSSYFMVFLMIATLMVHLAVTSMP